MHTWIEKHDMEIILAALEELKGIMLDEAIQEELDEPTWIPHRPYTKEEVVQLINHLEGGE